MASQSTLPSRIEELNDAHVALFALGGAYMAVFAMCAFGWPSWLAHIARNAMYAPPKRAVFTGTKPECVLESMASQSTLPSRIEELNGAHVAVFAMYEVQRPSSWARTHRKKRDVCATRCHPGAASRLFLGLSRNAALAKVLRRREQSKIRKTNLECSLE